MNDKASHRYLFTVRQTFGETPSLDSFYEVQVPEITQDQADMMLKLQEDFCRDEIKADTDALKAMMIRLRYNSDMFQNVCLVISESSMNRDNLQMIIDSKFKEGNLIEFLKGSSL